MGLQHGSEQEGAGLCVSEFRVWSASGPMVFRRRLQPLPGRKSLPRPRGSIANNNTTNQIMADFTSTVVDTLDVRSVAARNRFEMIMGRYQKLRPGQTFLLIVDHDPKCMYYTLKADYSDEAFRFDYLDDGPEVWRVHITKREV